MKKAKAPVSCSLDCPIDWDAGIDDLDDKDGNGNVLAMLLCPKHGWNWHWIPDDNSDDFYD